MGLAWLLCAPSGWCGPESTGQGHLVVMRGRGIETADIRVQFACIVSFRAVGHFGWWMDGPFAHLPSVAPPSLCITTSHQLRQVCCCSAAGMRGMRCQLGVVDSWR